MWTLSQILSRKFDKFYDIFQEEPRKKKKREVKSASEKYAAQMLIKKEFNLDFFYILEWIWPAKFSLTGVQNYLWILNFILNSFFFCSSLFLTFILLCCLHELNIFRSSAIKQAASNVNVKIYLLDLYRRGEGETAKTILTRCRRLGSLELFSSLFIFFFVDF